MYQSQFHKKIATRVGELRLKIPQVRGLSFAPSIAGEGLQISLKSYCVGVIKEIRRTLET